MTETDIHLFQNMPIFGGLTEASLELIVNRSEVVEVKKGGYFYQEGDHGNSLYVLTQGSVKGLKSIDGDEFQIDILSEGDCFGIMELINPSPRLNTVLAQTDCTALKVSGLDLLQLYKQNLEQYTMIQMNMAREISRRLRILELSICDFGSKHYHFKNVNL
ncbi:MAG: Crp/Fnr family transcriptional regulator [Lentisphaeria bacterium]|nr:Crp/Fnr family transcriptional regulator [Lentisphaeria bacterium]